jgi:ferritin-like protein
MLGAIVIHANSGTIWHVHGNTRLQLVASGGVSQNNIINALIQMGAVDWRATYYPPVTIYAIEGLKNIT